MSEKLSRLKRINVFNNGLINDPNGKLVLYSELSELLRDEIAGANVHVHTNSNPDGNEASEYVCVTSDKFNICLTAAQVAEAKARYANQPWIPKPKPVVVKKAKKKAAKKVAKK